MSSGRISMLNADIVDLYDRVKVGTKVIVIKGSPNDATAATQQSRDTLARPPAREDVRSGSDEGSREGPGPDALSRVS